MPRLKALANADVAENVRTAFDTVQRKLGTVPNLVRTLANAPAALEAYLGISGALARGTLPAKLREQLALTVGEANKCEYCISAHTALGRLAGLDDNEILAGRRGTASDAKSAIALTFARKLVAERGRASDDDINRLRAAGFDDGAVAEIVAHVAMNIFTNYFNHVALTEVDFPTAQALDPAPSCAG